MEQPGDGIGDDARDFQPAAVVPMLQPKLQQKRRLRTCALSAQGYLPHCFPLQQLRDKYSFRARLWFISTVFKFVVATMSAIADYAIPAEPVHTFSPHTWRAERPRSERSYVVGARDTWCGVIPSPCVSPTSLGTEGSVVRTPGAGCCKTWSFIGTTTTGSSLVHCCKLYWEPACAALRLGSDARLN